MIRGLARLVPKRLRSEFSSWVRAKGLHAATERIAPIEARLAEVERRMTRVEARGADLDTALQQALRILEREAQLAPLPPKHLQERVVGGYVPRFLDSGYLLCRELDDALADVGETVGSFQRILDFGCGSGRVIRALKALYPHVEICGTDIDPEAIDWLTENYSRFGRFMIAPHEPPTSYPAGEFDFVFGISVFTHLPEEMANAWLAELARIAAPGAIVLLTTHGRNHWSGLSPDIVGLMEEKGFFYGDFGWNYGRSVSLPDFYQTAYHSTDYIRREWTRWFEVVSIRELGMDRHQDTVLLRKPA